MARTRKVSSGSAAAAAGGGAGGIMGSGIFGMFGTTVHCDAESNSMYCNFMKAFNFMIVLFFILFILYVIYGFISHGKRRR